jgi:hypothetical protein
MQGAMGCGDRVIPRQETQTACGLSQRAMRNEAGFSQSIRIIRQLIPMPAGQIALELVSDQRQVRIPSSIPERVR